MHKVNPFSIYYTIAVLKYYFRSNEVVIIDDISLIYIK